MCVYIYIYTYICSSLLFSLSLSTFGPLSCYPDEDTERPGAGHFPKLPDKAPPHPEKSNIACLWNMPKGSFKGSLKGSIGFRVQGILIHYGIYPKL